MKHFMLCCFLGISMLMTGCTHTKIPTVDLPKYGTPWRPSSPTPSCMEQTPVTVGIGTVFTSWLGMIEELREFGTSVILPDNIKFTAVLYHDLCSVDSTSGKLTVTMWNYGSVVDSVQLQTLPLRHTIDSRVPIEEAVQNSILRLEVESIGDRPFYEQERHIVELGLQEKRLPFDRERSATPEDLTWLKSHFWDGQPNQVLLMRPHGYSSMRGTEIPLIRIDLQYMRMKLVVHGAN